MTRTAVVTGASSGIGAAVARRLAKDGFDTVLVARRGELVQRVAEETGGRAETVDITDADAVRALAERIDSCDILVNNAGGALGADPVSGADPGHWQHMYAVNVLGTLHVTQALLPLLRRSAGTVVNVTSTAAFVNYETGGGYSAAKHAQHALTETMRLELCGEPVRVVEVAPGMVHTEEFALNRFHGDGERAAAVYAGVDRPLSAEDVAECVSFAVGLPQHVNIDQLVVRPLAQAAQHKIHRGGLFAG